MRLNSKNIELDIKKKEEKNLKWESQLCNVIAPDKPSIETVQLQDPRNKPVPVQGPVDCAPPSQTHAWDGHGCARSP